MFSLFVYSPGPFLDGQSRISRLQNVEGWLYITPYPLQEKNAFVSSKDPRFLSKLSAADRKLVETFKGFCENDTLIGPDFPWVEFVDIA